MAWPGGPLIAQESQTARRKHEDLALSDLTAMTVATLIEEVLRSSLIGGLFFTMLLHWGQSEHRLGCRRRPRRQTVLRRSGLILTLASSWGIIVV